jgi:hypothetical protein
MKSEVCKWRVPCFLGFLLHDECSVLGAFVGAACRSLTPAQRSGAYGDRQAAQMNGTGAFVGELRGSDPTGRLTALFDQGS